MHKAVILPLAKADIQEAVLWYKRQQDGLGKRFLQQAKNKLSLICDNPYSYSICYEAIRTVVIDVFRIWFISLLKKKRKPL